MVFKAIKTCTLKSFTIYSNKTKYFIEIVPKYQFGNWVKPILIVGKKLFDHKNDTITKKDRRTNDHHHLSV